MNRTTLHLVLGKFGIRRINYQKEKKESKKNHFQMGSYPNQFS